MTGEQYEAFKEFIRAVAQHEAARMSDQLGCGYWACEAREAERRLDALFRPPHDGQKG